MSFRKDFRVVALEERLKIIGQDAKQRGRLKQEALLVYVGNAILQQIPRQSTPSLS